MPALYEIASQIAAITSAEELPPDLEQQLDAAELDLKTKVDNICRVLADLKGEGRKFAEESRRLSDIGDTLQRKHDRLKEYVRASLDLAGLSKLDTQFFKLWIQRNGQPSVKCDGPIPEGFSRVSVDLDREKVLTAWKDGEEIPGVEVVVGKHLRIK